MASYITEDKLTEFGANLQAKFEEILQKDELNFAAIFKEYVEKETAELEKKLTGSEDWTKVKNTIDSLIQVFDENSDGELTPAEVLSKISEIRGEIDSLTQRVSDLEIRVDNVNKNVGELSEKINGIDNEIADAKAEVESKVAEQIGALDAKVQTNAVETFDSLANAILSGVSALENTLEDRMNEIRKTLGLPVESNTSASTSTDSSSSIETDNGDGAAL